MQKDNASSAGRPKRIALFYFLMASFTLLAILVLGEVCARLFFTSHPIPKPPPYSSINPYKPNPYIVNMRPYVFFHIPRAQYAQKILSYTNEYSINALGFRGDDFSIRPEKGKKRLVVLGDSIVEGHGVQVDQTFSSILNQQLSGNNWEVLSLGVQGASPMYFAANLKRYYNLHPDAVLLVVYENDLHDDEIREKSYFDSPFMENSNKLISAGTFGSLLQSSKLYSLLHTTWHTTRKTPLEEIIAQNAKIPSVHTKRYAGKKLSSFAVPNDKFAQRWNMSEKYLNYTLDNLREKNINIMVTSLCTVTLSFPEFRSYTDHCENLEDRVQNWAKENALPYLSLSKTIKSALDTYKTKDVLIMNDFHPTLMTHQLLADDLLPFVRYNLGIDNKKE